MHMPVFTETLYHGIIKFHGKGISGILVLIKDPVYTIVTCNLLRYPSSILPPFFILSIILIRLVNLCFFIIYIFCINLRKLGFVFHEKTFDTAAFYRLHTPVYDFFVLGNINCLIKHFKCFQHILFSIWESPVCIGKSVSIVPNCISV